MKEIGGSAGFGAAENAGKTPTADEKEAERMFRAAWEAMLIEGMGGEGGQLAEGMGELLGQSGIKGKTVESSGKEAGNAEEKDDFQKTIRQAMDKLKDSESTLKVCSICLFFD